jgi:hypothetical protein
MVMLPHFRVSCVVVKHSALPCAWKSGLQIPYSRFRDDLVYRMILLGRSVPLNSLFYLRDQLSSICVRNWLNVVPIGKSLLVNWHLAFRFDAPSHTELASTNLRYFYSVLCRLRAVMSGSLNALINYLGLSLVCRWSVIWVHYAATLKALWFL